MQKAAALLSFSVLIPALIVALIIALVAITGCTNQQPAPQTTTPSTATVPVTAAAPAVPADLAQPWTVNVMAVQNGARIVRPTTEITLNIMPTGVIYGYSGCNNYNAVITLSGGMTTKGYAVAVGPITVTKKYCQIYSDQESLYLGILQDAMAYNVNGDKLTITAHDGTAIGFIK